MFGLYSSVRLNIDFEGRLMSSQVAAFLPSAVTEVLHAIELEEGQSSAMEDGVLQLNRRTVSDDETAWATKFNGRLRVNDASFQTGLPFSEATGPFDLDISKQPDEPAELEINVQLEHARVIGQDLLDLRAHLELSDDGRSLLLKEFRADAGPGVATAEAAVGVGENRDYDVQVRLVDVPLEEFALDAVSDAAPASDEPATETSGRPRGHLYAGIDLAGRLGEPSSRRGRGIFRVLDGRLAEIPVAFQLVQMLHMTLPAGGLDYADADFFIAGRRVIFERVLFEGTRNDTAILQLFGEGSMNLADYELDMLFRSRSGVAVLRDIAGALGDQLAAIRVRGPLWEPETSLMALPGMNPQGRPEMSAQPPADEPEDEPSPAASSDAPS